MMTTRCYSNYGDVMTVEEATELLHVSKKVVYTLIKNYKIQAVKIGAKYVIPKSTLIEIIEGKRSL